MKLFARLQYILPKRLLTWLVGHLADCRIGVIKNLLIRLSVRVFDINLDEAMQPDPDAYTCFNDFFARPLKPGVRPICQEPNLLVSPVDGAVSAFGRIELDCLLQAKNTDYTLNALLAGETDQVRHFRNGHFITLYLSPRDYHRIHWPLAARVLSTHYVPGTFFSVNQATVEGVPNLFARNERLVITAESQIGQFAVILVGAMIVAAISTDWHPQPYRGSSVAIQQPLDLPNYALGSELGRFNMGSTVIILLPDVDMTWMPDLALNQALLMGEKIATFKPVLLES